MLIGTRGHVWLTLSELEPDIPAVAGREAAVKLLLQRGK